jgi:hypothetical protein
VKYYNLPRSIETGSFVVSLLQNDVSQKKANTKNTYQTYEISFEKRNCQVSIILCAMVKYSILYLFVRNGDQLSKGFIHTILSRFPWNEMHDHKLLVTWPLYFMIFPWYILCFCCFFITWTIHHFLSSPIVSNLRRWEDWKKSLLAKPSRSGAFGKWGVPWGPQSSPRVSIVNIVLEVGWLGGPQN